MWTAPGWQVLSSRVQEWSWQPCVRPVSAVHVTAGHYSEVCEMSVNSLVYLLSEVPTFPESRIGKAMGSSGSQSFSGNTGVTWTPAGRICAAASAYSSRRERPCSGAPRRVWRVYIRRHRGVFCGMLGSRFLAGGSRSANHSSLTTTTAIVFADPPLAGPCTGPFRRASGMHSVLRLNVFGRAGDPCATGSHP